MKLDKIIERAKLEKQKRVMHLTDWVLRTREFSIPKIVEKDMELFQVSERTALDDAKLVIYRLKKGPRTMQPGGLMVGYS